MNNPIFETAVFVAKLAENPVALTDVSSPIINVPSVIKPEIVLPVTLVTVNLALELVPVNWLPTLGKIPLWLVKVKSTVLIWLIVRLTYLTLAGGCGGSENTIESCWILNEVPGVCTTPFKTTINWLALATTFVLLTVNGNEILSPSNRLEISSTRWTTEVRIFSEDVNLFCLNSTSVLLNSE